MTFHISPKKTDKKGSLQHHLISHIQRVPLKKSLQIKVVNKLFSHINQFAQTDFDCMELSENTQEAYIEAARGTLPELTLASQTNVYVAMHGYC